MTKNELEIKLKQLQSRMDRLVKQSKNREEKLFNLLDRLEPWIKALDSAVVNNVIKEVQP